MSFVNPQGLKSPADLTIPFSRFSQAFTTAQLRIDTAIQFSKIIKSLRIVNNDAINNLTYRTQSPSGLLKQVDITSEITDDEWGSFLEVNPNGATGTGFVELDLVDFKDARQAIMQKIGF